MSSENLQYDDNELFSFKSESNTDDDVLATYVITTPVDGERAALGIAREQSVCATRLNGVEMPRDVGDYCARVVAVEALPAKPQGMAALYFLNTTVYGSGSPDRELGQFKVVIAYPVNLFGHSLTRLWNSVFGEIHRLGYLSAAVLTDIRLPPLLTEAYPGPKFGVAGIREKLGVWGRPVFCRSMRPASSLNTDTMLQINESVLSGGFDVIKDDELTYDCQRSPFADRVRRMVDMKHRIEDQTGERKLYFANVIDDYSRSLEMVEQSAAFGADGVLLSTTAQGLSFIGEVASRTELIILSHNSCGDVITRTSAWGASNAVMAKLQRAAGADLVVSPGPFATTYQDAAEAQAFLESCHDRLGRCEAILPIIQGGKQPGEIAQYTADVGSTDYMLIAATWLDNHPDGIKAGARAFRDAWDVIAWNGNQPKETPSDHKNV